MTRLGLRRAPRRARETGRRAAGARLTARSVRALGATAAVTVLALTASGCVTVHGELALVPAAGRDEAAQALADFTAAYNAADKAYDPALDAGRVTGPLGEINQAGLRSGAATSPGGNKNHRPLALTDARFVVPRTTGWPRWFVADADANTDVDQGDGDQRWLLVFVRNGPHQLWEAAHLAIVPPSVIPAFAEEEGYAVPVAADTDALAVPPSQLGTRYAAYLKDGSPGPYAAGPHTSQWRERRAKNAKRPALATQYVDRAADQGDFAPLGLRTRDGGAFVFFATRYFERQTAAPGYRPKVEEGVKALLKGTVTNTVTKEWVSNQVALVKPAGTERNGVAITGRIQGIVGAQGS
ncbi:hypothetical protein AB0G79_08930 [Streptomyces sp. NPDC020807]|uniref:hypothetical protein n=1 Tax=Streptomyces sp. NPDC020807 TaxID=3155119 RepID=UPI0033F00891